MAQALGTGPKEALGAGMAAKQGARPPQPRALEASEKALSLPSGRLSAPATHAAEPGPN